jgi:hypothetical protein
LLGAAPVGGGVVSTVDSKAVGVGLGVAVGSKGVMVSVVAV